MATFGFKLDDAQVKKTFSKLDRTVRDFTQPLNEAGEEMLKLYSEDSFKNQGVTGEKWKPLSAATLMMREKRTGYYKNPPTGDSGILVWTGNMRSSFNKMVSKVKLVIGNSASYFEHHQRRGGRTPQRRMLYLSKDIIVNVQNKVMNYINQGMK